MKIVEPYARLLEPETLHDALPRIEAVARVSHRSEDAQTATTTDRFIRAVVLSHGDWSVVEHVDAKVEFYVDRGITHEIVRHRLFSYTQESTRFVNYQKKMPASFIYPLPINCSWCVDDDNPPMKSATGSWVHLNIDDPQSAGVCAYDSDWLDSISQAEQSYQRLLATGWPPQLGRSVFPNALASKLVMTGNLRSWRHFFRMRTTKEAHPQMRQVTIPLLAQFQAAVPIIFEDIQPEARQADNVRLPC
jgi:thymidylate synthase (FAD)